MRLACLRQKEVINICDCKCLGCIADIEFNEKTGCIEKFIIPGPARFCGLFGHDCEYIIPFRCVKQIGEDIVLVEINPEECVKKC